MKDISIICEMRNHCQACRDMEGGRIWRESLHKAFWLPDDEIDFECPHGIPWGAGPQTEVLVQAQAKRESELGIIYAEYRRINGICEPCADEDCDFYKLKGCTKKNQVKNSLGPAKELIQCPKKLLY